MQVLQMENFSHYKPQSSQSPIRERTKYDIFLSFRGPDVRKTLVDHLYRSLSTAGVNVFLDSEKLEKGEDIGISLQQAIQNSTIYIPIFSPDYASSAWCLKELSLMWQIKSTSAQSILMIPLFYKVNPSHVRHPECEGGSYAEAFNKHQTQDRYSPKAIERWRDALYHVSRLSGWSLEETSSGYEGKLVDHVVKDVLQSLDSGMREVAEHPVGLKTRTEEVIQLLKLGDSTSNRLTLGIWGMSGLGKTNLSKALYNQIHLLFQASSFVSNVKLEDSCHGLKKLQQLILKDLLKTKIKLNDIDHGNIVMRERLASLQALVVLDGVDNERQLDALMGDWFGKGSRIIITTQNKRVLEVRQVDVIYPMRGLEPAEAVELFSWHAFRRDRPERGYENMTDRIVKTCSGLPLSLRIIGTDLYNRDKTRYWPEVLHKLENVGHDFVFETLKISYSNLTPVEKHIFLDIACFFVEIKSSDFIQNRAFSTHFYTRFWSALGCESVITSLKTLEEKALVVMHEHRYTEAIDEENNTGHYFCEFSMHDHIRDMGRRIVREESWNDPTKRSRVWREEDICSLMAATTIQENKNVEGLMWRKRMQLQHIDTLAPLQKLGFLLWWELQVKTEIERLPTNLKYLVFSECQFKDDNPLVAGTDSVSDHNESSVLPPVLPKSIAGIESGGDQKLDFILCWNLQVKTKLKRLARKLKYLVLAKCQSMEYDPQMTGQNSDRDDDESPLLSPVLAKSIAQLDNESPVLSPVLPKSIAQLIYLRYLDMSGTRQTCLPKEICELLCLEELYLSRCSLMALPVAFGNLINLKSLDVSNNFLSAFPPSFERLKSLVNLEMAWNEQLVVFPALPEVLTALNARGCSKLKAISLENDMKVLKTMDLSHCESLTGISTQFGWKSLRDLRLEGCKQLDKLEPLPECLTSLRTSGCSKLQNIFFTSSRLATSLETVPYEIEMGSSARPYEIEMDSDARGSCVSRPSVRRYSVRGHSVRLSGMKDLCMIGCDNIRLNIYHLLKDFHRLERLDLSLSSEPLGEAQPCVGKKKLTLQSCNLCVAIFFCFVVESKKNAHLPHMDVLMTYLNDVDGDLLSKTFEVPSCMKGDDSGRFIMRVCIWNTKTFVEGGTASCSYSVHDQLSQQGSSVLLRQVEFLVLEENATFENAAQFLQQWKLLSTSNDIYYHINDGMTKVERIGVFARMLQILRG